MIRIIKTYDECRDFASNFNGDPNFSDPMLCHEEQLQHNLIKSIEKPDRHCVFGIYREDQIIGLFAFLVLQDEHYIEMLVGLSREKEAYLEMFHYLEQSYPDYSADFVTMRELISYIACFFAKSPLDKFHLRKPCSGTFYLNTRKSMLYQKRLTMVIPVSILTDLHSRR